MKQLRRIGRVVLLVSLACSSSNTLAADSNIVGTQRLVSMLSRDTVTGAENHTWGEGPRGFITYTADGRMSAILAKADRSISADSAGKAPIEEQAMLFRNSFAYAGRYSLTSDGVIHHVEVAADPTWMGKDQRRLARVEGNKLVISSPPIKSVTSPNPIEFSLVWERVEQWWCRRRCPTMRSFGLSACGVQPHSAGVGHLVFTCIEFRTYPSSVIGIPQ